MNVRRFEDFREFHAHAGPYLQRHEIAHILQLGFLNTWMQTGAPSIPPYLGLVEHDQEPIGIAMRVNNFRAILSEAVDVQAAVELFVQDMQDAFAENPLSGASGSPAETRAFVDLWQHATGCVGKLNRAERIYKLTEVIPVRHVSGKMRPAAEGDVPLLADWFKAFDIEADPTADANTPIDVYVGWTRFRLETDPALRGLRVWEDGGKVVSMAGYAGPTGHGIRVAPVYTPPELRGRGYASAVTAALTQELLDTGKAFVALFTDLANPTSNSIYQKIGYKPQLDVDEYIFVNA
ncbi:MAG: GNAT family N-acetyltransferase [Anaerolineae bacterium]